MEASPVKSTSSNKEPPSQNKSVESNESVEIPYTGDVLPRRGMWVYTIGSQLMHVAQGHCIVKQLHAQDNSNPMLELIFLDGSTEMMDSAEMAKSCWMLPEQERITAPIDHKVLTDIIGQKPPERQPMLPGYVVDVEIGGDTWRGAVLDVIDRPTESLLVEVCWDAEPTRRDWLEVTEKCTRVFDPLPLALRVNGCKNSLHHYIEVRGQEVTGDMILATGGGLPFNLLSNMREYGGYSYSAVLPSSRVVMYPEVLVGGDGERLVNGDLILLLRAAPAIKPKSVMDKKNTLAKPMVDLTDSTFELEGMAVAVTATRNLTSARGTWR